MKHPFDPDLDVAFVNDDGETVQLADWRELATAAGDRADENDEVSEEEHQAVTDILGFDPDELDDPDEEEDDDDDDDDDDDEELRRSTFKEEEHPRAEDGRFGTKPGKKKPVAKPTRKPRNEPESEDARKEKRKREREAMLDRLTAYEPRDPDHPAAVDLEKDADSRAALRRFVDAAWSEEYEEALQHTRREKEAYREMQAAEENYGSNSKEAKAATKAFLDINLDGDRDRRYEIIARQKEKSRAAFEQIMKPRHPPRVEAIPDPGTEVIDPVTMQPSGWGRPGFKPDETQKQGVAEAMRFVTAVTEGAAVNHTVTLKMSESGRACFSAPNAGQENPQIGLPGTTGESFVPTVVHEMGHFIDEMKPGVRERVKAFLEYRVGDETPVDMASIPGGDAMRGELGRKDEFDRHFDTVSAHYVGKVYSDGVGKTYATEIVSMGLEALYRDPLGFCTKDPEYAQFIIGILRM